MKKLLLSLICLVSMLSMSAVTLTMENYGADFVSENGYTAEGFTFTILKNGGQTSPTYNVNGKDVRIYAKGTIKITSTEPMTKVNFVLSTQGLKRLAPITASTGTIATQAAGDKYVKWTGNATEVTFTVGEKADFGSDGSAKGGQLDFSAIVINEDVPDTPNPPVPDVTEVANIAAFNQLANNTKAKITNPVTAVAQAGIYMYIHDNSGFGLVYGSLDRTYKNGDVIPAGITGTMSIYGGLTEMKPDKATFGAPTAGTAVQPATATIADIATAELHSFVKIEGVKVSDINGKNATITDASGATLPLYNNLGAAIVEGENVTVTGFVAVYNEKRQLYPLTLSNSGDLKEGEVDNIAEFIKKADASAPCIIKNPVTAVYQSGNRLWITDSSEAWLLIFGQVGQTYKNGDVIPAGITGTYQLYNSAPQMSSPVADTFKAGTEGTPVAPTETTLEDLNAEPLNSLVEIKNIKVAAGEQGGRYFDMSDANGNTITLYNQFDLEIITGDNINVTGIVCKYKDAYQVYAISTTPASGIETVEIDNNAPAVYYNLNGVQVATPTSGLYIVKQGNKVSKVIIK